MLTILPLLLVSMATQVQSIDISASTVLTMKFEEILQPDVAQGTEVSPASTWGNQGSWRWGIQGSYAEEINNSNNELATIGAEFEYFVEDNLSIDIGLHVMDVNQVGGSTEGINATLLLRWHFIDDRTWSMFIEGGAGLLRTSEKVPTGSSQFNFTPQIGVGVSFDIGNSNRWLIGIRLHHISNANLYSLNPGRDSIMVWTGISFPF